MRIRETRTLRLVGQRTIRYFVGMVAAFFLALVLWGQISGTRELFTNLEQRLRLLQEQLVNLQEQLNIMADLLSDNKNTQDALSVLREQLQAHIKDAQSAA